ncbi:MAG: biopolymer transporter ExbD [Myxococcales bacterium]|nr:biopolymer transporter ExbD [Myxococcales bacterium]
MSGKPPEDEGEAIFAEINITPLTDIFLVLLIIFMVTSSVKMEEIERGARSGVTVNLPKGASKELAPGASDVTVAITTDGHMVVDGKTVDPDQLRAIFASAHQKDADTQVIVQADEATHHGRVVGVMELAKTAGLRRLAIATRRAPK